MKRNYFLLIGLFNCFFLSAAYAQTIKEKSASLLFEKAYLHTDRDVYAQGDTLWFKAYLVNAQDSKPASSSGNLYVELILPDSARILNREIIRMNSCLGKGDIALDDSLPAGNYRLRAYTNWMRNFGDNFVFEKNITLLNTKAVPEASAGTGKGSSSTKQENNKKTATATATFSPATNILPTVRFYPEGGSLVNGISSFVGVKAEDGFGKGIPASGAVISSSGDTVSHFTCDSLGIGMLAMLPIAGQSYHAEAYLAANRKDVFQLPAALSKGLALQLKQGDSVIHAIVHAVGISDSTFSMVLKHGGKTALSRSFALKDAQLAFKISTTELPEGISAITIYDAANKPECERLVYVHAKSGSSGSKSGLLRISSNKPSYQPKEQAIITIETQPNSNLSMAVVDASVVPKQTTDIVSYLNLQSELRGNIESPNRYFDTTNVNRNKQLDQLLLTQGWRDFIWRRMADTTIRISYAAENGINVSGRIRDENLNKLLPHLNISLYASEAKNNKLFSTTSDSLGRFHFNELLLYGKQNIALSAVNEKGQSKGAFWVDTLLPMPVNKRSLAKPVNRADALQAIQKKQAGIKLSKINGVTQLKEVQIKERGKSQAFSVEGIPGNSFTIWGENFDQNFKITPKDYELKTLRWFALNHFYGARPVDDQIGFPSEKNRIIIPTLIINGKAPLFPIDPNLYYSMPLEKFTSIHIQRVLSAQDTLSYLLFLNLKDGYLTDNPGSLTTNVEGYYQARIFYEPLPNVKFSVNDYRTTIYWEPNIKTDAIGKAIVSFIMLFHKLMCG